VRLIKTFGLAAIVTVAATAFIGVSAAAAGNTALCKSNEAGALTCADVNKAISIHAVATDLVFLSAVNILCGSSLLQATVLPLGAPQVAHITSLTWNDCLLGATTCIVTVLKLGLILLLKTAANLGDALFHDTEWRVQCGIFVNCEYGGLFVLHLLGSSAFGDGPSGNGGTRGTKTELGSGNSDAPCPETLWDVFYESLTPVYVKS
jgi:hypothetical protein